MLQPAEQDTHPEFKDGSELDQSRTFLGGQHHPWRRFWARTVDIGTSGVILLVLVAVFVSSVAPDLAARLTALAAHPAAGGIAVYLVWIPAESLMLAFWGATPAKWLFGIKVTGMDSGRLSIGASFQRASMVFVQGAGLGIPIVALFTQLFAYRRLTKTGQTLWDRGAGTIVQHKKWGIFRAMACTAAVIFVLAVLSVLNAAGSVT